MCRVQHRELTWSQRHQCIYIGDKVLARIQKKITTSHMPILGLSTNVNLERPPHMCEYSKDFCLERCDKVVGNAIWKKGPDGRHCSNSNFKQKNDCKSHVQGPPRFPPPRVKRCRGNHFPLFTLGPNG